MRDILFQNSIITLRTLNVAIALGFLFAGIFAVRYTERQRMNLNFLPQNYVYILLGILLGGRLAYGIREFAHVQQEPLSLLYIWDLNFSFIGMILGGLLALYILTKKAHEDFWAWVDMLALSSLALLIFAHVGYYFSGIGYGLPTTLPWGIAFEANHIPFVSPLHPTQLYAALLTLILLSYSVKMSRRIHISGIVGSRAMMIYSLGMLGIEFLLGDPSLYGKISYAVMAILSFVAYIHCSHKTHITN